MTWRRGWIFVAGKLRAREVSAVGKKQGSEIDMPPAMSNPNLFHLLSTPHPRWFHRIGTRNGISSVESDIIEILCWTQRASGVWRCQNGCQLKVTWVTIEWARTDCCLTRNPMILSIYALHLCISMMVLVFPLVSSFIGRHCCICPWHR